MPEGEAPKPAPATPPGASSPEPAPSKADIRAAVLEALEERGAAGERRVELKESDDAWDEVRELNDRVADLEKERERRRRRAADESGFDWGWLFVAVIFAAIVVVDLWRAGKLSWLKIRQAA